MDESTKDEVRDELMALEGFAFNVACAGIAGVAMAAWDQLPVEARRAIIDHIRNVNA